MHHDAHQIRNPQSAIRNPEKLQRLAGARALVIGLGRFGGGVGVTRWLVNQGAVVTVTDRAGRDALADSIRALADLDVTLHFGSHEPAQLDGVELVVVNPAVDKKRSPFFREVVRQAIPWTTEINLFCQRSLATIIAVTGSYGKSTTCVMLADALRAWHRAGTSSYTDVHLGGNIGRSLLSDLDSIRATDLVVLELSNAQLEDLPRIGWAPPIAVINNLWPHHLDRYGTFEGYLAAKLNILADPNRVSRVFVGDVDPAAAAMIEDILRSQPQRLIRITRPRPPVELRVPGDHNQANAACVMTVCSHLGMDETVVRESLGSFPGLPHRLEHVRAIGGVDYYNDSKSTSLRATLTAVAALRRPVVAITGGQKKSEPLVEWAGNMIRACRMVICFGQSGAAFAQALRRACHCSMSSAAAGVIEGHAPLTEQRHEDGLQSAAPSKTEAGSGPICVVREAANLDEAVLLARNGAHPGDAILFSPGAPSFDRYANFAERGHHFCDIVKAL